MNGIIQGLVRMCPASLLNVSEMNPGCTYISCSFLFIDTRISLCAYTTHLFVCLFLPFMSRWTFGNFPGLGYYKVALNIHIRISVWSCIFILRVALLWDMVNACLPYNKLSNCLPKCIHARTI